MENSTKETMTLEERIKVLTKLLNRDIQTNVTLWNVREYRAYPTKETENPDACEFDIMIPATGIDISALFSLEDGYRITCTHVYRDRISFRHEYLSRDDYRQLDEITESMRS